MAQYLTYRCVCVMDW